MIYNTFLVFSICSILLFRSKAEAQVECPSEGVSFVPDLDCSKYYICANGEANLQTCPNDLYFNPLIHACDYPANVPECVGGTRPPIPEPTEPVTSTMTTRPTPSTTSITEPTQSITTPRSTGSTTPVIEPSEPSTSTSISSSTQPTKPTDLPSTTETPPSDILRNCGDNIIGNDEGLIEYKLGQTYIDNERCAFIIRSLIHSSFLFTLEENGIYDDSTLQGGAISIFGFGANGLQDTVHLGPPNPLNTTFVQGSVVVVVFKSEAYRGTGFRLRYQGLGSPELGINNFEDLIFSNATGSLNYPLSGGNYLPETGSLFVISNTHRRIPSIYERLNLNISRLDLDACDDSCSCDYLMVYSFDSESLLDELERACHQEDLRSFDTRGIFVVFFKSDETNSKTGFTLDWQVQEILV